MVIARSASRSARRIAGSDGSGGGPGVGRSGFSPAPLAAGRGEAAVLEEGERDHGEERVVVQPRPAPALVMVEPQLLLQLLVRQADCPATQGGRPCSHTQRALIARASARSEVRTG